MSNWSPVTLENCPMTPLSVSIELLAARQAFLFIRTNSFLGVA